MQYADPQTLIIPQRWKQGFPLRVVWFENNQEYALSFTELIPKFIDYIEFDETAAKQTVAKYRDCLNWLVRDLEHILSPTNLSLEDVTDLKRKMSNRGVGPARINSIIFALRRFLKYCQSRHKINTINPTEIKPMKIPKREVVYLTKEEVQKLFESINTKDVRGLRFRALAEVLLSTLARISEALSINRDQINWEAKEVVIIGKGNKQRTGYFNDRSLYWLKEYLGTRKDNNPALFVTFGEAARLARYDLGKQFRHHATKAGIQKKFTPHIMRHTGATIMLNNGCDIRFIQELLGHSDIKTTAKYYLGLDKRAVKDARSKFLNY